MKMLSNQKETGSQIGQARKLNLGGLGTNLGFEMGWTGLGVGPGGLRTKGLGPGLDNKDISIKLHN